MPETTGNETLKKVQAGDPLRIKASDWNAFIDATRAAKKFDSRPQGSLGGGGYNGNTILVQNDSPGSDFEMFATVGLEGPVIGPTDNLSDFQSGAILFCTVPTNDHRGRFAITIEPIARGSIGRAVVSGVVPAVLTIADETHEFADVYPNFGELKSGDIGAARILWKPTGTGVSKWAVVEVGGGERTCLRRFRLKNGLQQGYSAYATFYWGPQEQHTATVEVWDLQKKHSSPGTFASDNPGAEGIALWNLDAPSYPKWEILSLQRPADFFGRLTQSISNSYSPAQAVTLETVSGLPLHFGGWLPFGTGQESVTAICPPLSGTTGTWGFDAPAGALCLCRWDAGWNLYRIVWVENSDFNANVLNVVTRTSLAIDFDAKTFSHHYYTQQIKLPRWLPVGEEVEH